MQTLVYARQSDWDQVSGHSSRDAAVHWYHRNWDKNNAL